MMFGVKVGFVSMGFLFTIAQGTSRVKLEDFHIAKMKLGTPSHLLSPKKILSLYQKSSESEQEIKKIKDIYLLSMIRALCDYSSLENSCKPIKDETAGIAVVVKWSEAVFKGTKPDLGVSTYNELVDLLAKRNADNHDGTSHHPSPHMVHAELNPILYMAAPVPNYKEDIPMSVYNLARGAATPVQQTVIAKMLSVFTPAKILINLSDSPIYKSGVTGVYGITELPNAVIKYYSWCPDEFEPIDGVIVESFFMEKLSPIGLAPKIFYYSDYFGFASRNDGTYLPLANGKKIESYFYGTCDAVNGATDHSKLPKVRYIIMEKVGSSVRDFVKQTKNAKTRLINAMKFGGQMIILLRKLHSFDIVHGDAHWGNFAFKSPLSSASSSMGELLMIDYSRAKLIEDVEPTPMNSADVHHVFNSKWEDKLYKPSFRDDVYRAVLNSAFAIYGIEFEEYLRGLIDANSPEYEPIKNGAKFFEAAATAYNLDWFANPSWPQGIEAIRRYLGYISELVSSDALGYFSRPDYDKIIFCYREILKLLDPGLVGKLDTEIFFN